MKIEVLGIQNRGTILALSALCLAPLFLVWLVVSIAGLVVLAVETCLEKLKGDGR